MTQIQIIKLLLNSVSLIYNHINIFINKCTGLLGTKCTMLNGNGKMAILRGLSWNKFFKIPNKNPPGRPPSKFMKSQDIKNRGTYGRFCMKSCNKNLRNSEIQ